MRGARVAVEKTLYFIEEEEKTKQEILRLPLVQLRRGRESRGLARSPDLAAPVEGERGGVMACHTSPPQDRERERVSSTPDLAASLIFCFYQM